MRTILTCFLLLGILFGCTSGESEIRVSAASSLTDVLAEVTVLFESRFPQYKIKANFAGSNVLRQQIEAGAPVDVFVPASDKTMNGMLEQGLLLSAPVPLFSNRLAVVVPGGAKTRPERFSDLTHPDVKRIAIGGPGVPVRFYTEEALKRLNLWKSLTPKYVYASGVRQVVDYVARGEADAGFVYLTDTIVFRNRLVTAWTVPDSLHSPIVYPGAALRDAKNVEGALSFLGFLESAPAREIFKRHGFEIK